MDSLRERRAIVRARALAADGQLDEALVSLEDCEGDEADAMRDDLKREGARKWLRRALQAAERDEGDTLRRHRARAGRYWMPEIDSWYREIDRLLRRRNVALTAAEHWVELVDTAAHQRSRWEEVDEPTLDAMPTWRTFIRRELLAAVRHRWNLRDRPLTLDDLEGADDDALRQVADLVRAGYPTDLADAVDRLGPELVRAVLLISCGRPDLAALPLVELPESEPVVCFERARVAHCLGLPEVALVALQGFATRAGGHTCIRRLHTAVFAAQMALACDERDHALELLRRHVAVRQLGGRPLVLTARLLAETGQEREALELLRDHLAEHPEHEPAQTLLDQLTDGTGAPSSPPP